MPGKKLRCLCRCGRSDGLWRCVVLTDGAVVEELGPRDALSVLVHREQSAEAVLSVHDAQVPSDADHVTHRHLQPVHLRRRSRMFQLLGVLPVVARSDWIGSECEESGRPVSVIWGCQS